MTRYRPLGWVGSAWFQVVCEAHGPGRQYDVREGWDDRAACGSGRFYLWINDRMVEQYPTVAEARAEAERRHQDTLAEWIIA